MKIVSLSIGGGGAAINNSLRKLLDQDAELMAKEDPDYARLLFSRLSFRYADSNRDSLRFIHPDERIILGEEGYGCGHDPENGRKAFLHSKESVAEIMKAHDVILLLAATGKGTGAGSVVEAVKLARSLNKLVLPFVSMPSLNACEVGKDQYDRALGIFQQLNNLDVRYIQIMNDAAYKLDTNQDEAMSSLNTGLAKTMRSLLYVFMERSQFDRSDMAAFFAGRGRIRLGHTELGEIPAGKEAAEKLIKKKAEAVCKNTCYGFEGPIGSSLIMIQGPIGINSISMLRAEISRIAIDGKDDSPFSTHPADAPKVPKPWCVTAIFTEYTGKHQALKLDWLPDDEEMIPAKYTRLPGYVEKRAEPAPIVQTPAAALAPTARGARVPTPQHDITAPTKERPWTFKEFAKQIGRQNPVAIEIAKGEVDQTLISLPINGDDFKSTFGPLHFRQAITKNSFSEGWKNALRDAVRKEKITDRGQKGSSGTKLRAMTIDALETHAMGVVDINGSDSEWLRDAKFIVYIAECFGETFAYEILNFQATVPSNGSHGDPSQGKGNSLFNRFRGVHAPATS